MQTTPASCQHFAQCGGCHRQYLQLDDYLKSKRNKAVALAARLGCDAAIVGEMIVAGNHQRRRASFRVTVDKGRVSLGFNAYRSHEIIDLQQCLVLRPEIFAIIAPLRACLSAMKKPGAITEFRVTLVRDGLDIAYTTGTALKAPDKQMLIDLMHTQNVVRLCENGRRIAGGNAVIALGGVSVELPAEAFLQASELAQDAMIALVQKHLHPCARVVDLYSGCGTFSLPMAQPNRSLSAFEGSPEMIAALHNAALRANLAVSAHARDLYKHPLTASELSGFDGAVINPPHNGALPQAQQLATSGIGSIAMVSCNPATFERDAKALMQGGYRLIQLTPVDQFYWSSHLELVAAFVRQI